MGNTLDLETDNQYDGQYQYNRLLVALEASLGKLDLLIAVCEDRNLQARIIERYEQELNQQEIGCFRVWVQGKDPSLRLALERLVAQEMALTTGQAAVVTVQGIEGLLAVRLGEPQSQQEQFFGYLQWTREAFRQFHFPVVVWVTGAVLTQLAEKSPDFWSWRGGVFWFGLRPEDLPPQKTRLLATPTTVLETNESLKNLLQEIEVLEKQPEKKQDQLMSLFKQLGELYAKRYTSYKDRQFAIQAFKRVIQLQTQLGQQADLARSWEQLGDLYAELKDDIGQAMEAYNHALRLYRETRNHWGEASILKAIGDVLKFLNQSQDALHRYDEALRLYREVGSQLGEASTLKAIGDVLQFLKRSQDALYYYNEALVLFREVESRLGEASTLKAIGEVLKFLKQNQEALSCYDEALTLFRNIGDRLGEASTLKEIGDVLQFLKQSYDALRRYDEALALFREIGTRLGEANTLKAIGDVLKFLKQSHDALRHYDEALTLFREVGARWGEANTLRAIGDVLQLLKQNQEALHRYDEALVLFQVVGDRLGEAYTLKSIGDVLQFLDQRQDALRRYDAALILYRAVGSRLGEANVLQELGKMADDPVQALAKLQQAQQLYEEIGDRYSQSRNLVEFMADVQLQLGDRAGAIISLQQAAELAKDTEFEFFREAALEKLKELQANNTY